MAMLFVIRRALLAAVLAAAASATPAAASGAAAPQLPTFQFGPVFGDDMVLQQQPAMAAVYGYTGLGGTSVTVTVTEASGREAPYTVLATLNTTQQPFGQ